MSKVVHLTDEAHNKAKQFCKDNSLRMSDWVATLIDEAISRGHASTAVRTVVPKKKPLHRLPEVRDAPANEEALPAYAAPPFWARRKGG